MGLCRIIARRIHLRMQKLAASREPDFLIGKADDIYLARWFVIPRNRLFNVYLHQFCRSDDDRALHDHPWWNLSFLINGTYTEHTIKAGGINVRKRYRAGDFKFRRATAAHRIELTDGPSWSLFITGPRLRHWGFHCPNGWKPWEEFTKKGNPGEIGPGCDDEPDFREFDASLQRAFFPNNSEAA